MSSRKWEFRIQDMLDSISKIEKYADWSTFEQFIDDVKTSDAVIRQLTVIGEAAFRIVDGYPHNLRGVRFSAVILRSSSLRVSRIQ